jgi:hypothetical protein
MIIVSLWVYAVVVTIIAIAALIFLVRYFFAAKYGKARFAIASQAFAISTLAVACTTYSHDFLRDLTEALHGQYPIIPRLSFGISLQDLIIIALIVFLFLIWSAWIFSRWHAGEAHSAADRYIAEKDIPFLLALRALIYEVKHDPRASALSPPQEEESGHEIAESLPRKLSWPEAVRFLVVDKFAMVGASTKYSALSNSLVDSTQHIEVFLFETPVHLTPTSLARMTKHIDQTKQRFPQ